MKPVGTKVAVGPTTGKITFDRRANSSRVVFQNVPVELAPFHTYVVGSPAHAGFGYMGQVVNLRGAKLELDGREKHLEETGLRANLRPLLAYAQLVDTYPGIRDKVLEAAGLSMTIPSLELEVSGQVESARLRFEGRTRPYVPVCDDPAAGQCASIQYPTVDPFPYYLSDAEAKALNRAWEQFKENVRSERLETAGPTDCVGLVGAQTCSSVPELHRFAPGLIWETQLVPRADLNDRVWQAVATQSIDDGVVWSVLSGMQYTPASYPFYSPQNFQFDCGRIACSIPASTGTTEICATYRGRIENDRKRCYQWIRLHIQHENDTSQDPYADGNRNTHYVAGYLGATYGFYDADYDDMIIAFHTPDSVSAGWFGTKHFTNRSYYRSNLVGYSVAGEPICKNTENASIDGAEITTFSKPGQPSWNGTKFVGLKQWTNTYTLCGGGGTVKNRLWFAYFSGHAFFDAYRGRQGKLHIFYGHRKTSSSLSFGCGPGFGTGGFGVSCGYTPSTNETQAWVRDASTNFSY